MTDWPTFAISYGFLGGPVNSRQLRKKLKAAGYREAPIGDADIVIAHSGGSYLLDANTQHKLVVLAAPALPKENPRAAFRENAKQLWRSARTENYLKKRLLWSVYGFYSALRYPGRNHKIAKVASDTSFELPELKNSRVLFIVNQNDAWPTGPQRSKFLTKRPWTFISLPGAHEHIWVHPEDYMAIIKRYV